MKNSSWTSVGQGVSWTSGLSNPQPLTKQELDNTMSVKQADNVQPKCPTVKLALAMGWTVGQEVGAVLYYIKGYIYKYIYTPNILTRKEILTNCLMEVK